MNNKKVEIIAPIYIGLSALSLGAFGKEWVMTELVFFGPAALSPLVIKKQSPIKTII